MMRFLLTTILASLLVACSVPTSTEELSPERLRVLFVGNDPSTPEGYGYGGNSEYIAELNQTRVDEYTSFLAEYFDVVQVFAEDYNVEMSNAVDVTIFDALPMELQGLDMSTGERKEWRSSVRDTWKYLPEDFDSPAIIIAGLGAPIGDSLELKIDWSCHCLGEFAFGLDEAHDIFNRPYKVDIRYEDIATPNGIFGYYSGRDVGPTMPMWRVQSTDAHTEAAEYPPGFVSKEGFGDSPDAEIISGGSSIKSRNVTAIGRHGNFLQWGFRASPRFMEDAAKLAFVNSIHYIANFDGEPAYTKRVKGSVPRDRALDYPFRVSDRGQELARAEHERRLKQYEERLALVEAGELDRLTVSRRGVPKMRDQHYYAKLLNQELVEKIGENWNQYLEYYLDNYDYLTTVGNTRIDVDPDAQALGIANNDPAILDAAIDRLGGSDDELAARILARYTNESFDSAGAWREWVDANRDRLYFTETGGYKFLIEPSNSGEKQ